MIVQTIDEQIHLRVGDYSSEPLDWRRAQGLALTLQGHADECRRRQFTREGRCLSCGAWPTEQHEPDCEGPDGPPGDPTALRVRGDAA